MSLTSHSLVRHFSGPFSVFMLVSSADSTFDFLSKYIVFPPSAAYGVYVGTFQVIRDYVGVFWAVLLLVFLQAFFLSIFTKICVASLTFDVIGSGNKYTFSTKRKCVKMYGGYISLLVDSIIRYRFSESVKIISSFHRESEYLPTILGFLLVSPVLFFVFIYIMSLRIIFLFRMILTAFNPAPEYRIWSIVVLRTVLYLSVGGVIMHIAFTRIVQFFI